MPDWDADSLELRTNLQQILTEIAGAAKLRPPFTLAAAKQWHRTLLHGLHLPDPSFVAAFRGEPGLENVEVRVLDRWGPPAELVPAQLEQFQAKLQRLVAELDSAVPVGQLPDPDQLGAVIDLSAWAHAEWVRLHPFANGNGRIARLLVNFLALRYKLPPFLG